MECFVDYEPASSANMEDNCSESILTLLSCFVKLLARIQFKFVITIAVI